MKLNFKESNFVMHKINKQSHWQVVQLMINTTRDIWHIFQILLTVLIINCTPSCVFAYTYIALTFILQ